MAVRFEKTDTPGRYIAWLDNPGTSRGRVIGSVERYRERTPEYAPGQRYVVGHTEATRWAYRFDGGRVGGFRTRADAVRALGRAFDALTAELEAGASIRSAEEAQAEDLEARRAAARGRSARAFGPGDIVEYRRTSAPMQAWLVRGTRGRVVERIGRGVFGAVVVDFGSPFSRVYVDAADIRRIREAGSSDVVADPAAGGRRRSGGGRS